MGELFSPNLNKSYKLHDASLVNCNNVFLHFISKELKVKLNHEIVIFPFATYSENIDCCTANPY